MNKNYTYEAHVAQRTAREASAYLRGKVGRVQVEHQKASSDAVLDADVEAEGIIPSLLRTHFPPYGILSEKVGKEREDSPYCWVVDPLDGSANFQHGSPVFAVSIALALQNKTILRVIYLPMRNEMFAAILVQRAMLNGKLISCSQQEKVRESLIHLGDFGWDETEVNREQIRELTRVADHAHRIHITGTSCFDLAWIACGRAEALVMHGGNSWDVNAERLILEEASGRVSSHPYASGSILTLYSNGRIHQELTDILGVSL